MEYQSIRLAIVEGVATLTLARPDRLNALTPDMLDEMSHAVGRIGADGARALLLVGEGRAFSSGADLRSAGAKPPGEMLRQHYNPLVQRLSALPMPVVAAVHGAAAGAGCALALTADFVVAARSAYFLQAFVNIGLVPDAGATFMLPRLVGRARAAELMMLGERLDAAKAAEWGLIHKVVEDDALADEAGALARRLAAGPTRAFGLIRQGLALSPDLTLEDVLEMEARHQEMAAACSDAREGIAAFVDKREAKFSGK